MNRVGAIEIALLDLKNEFTGKVDIFTIRLDRLVGTGSEVCPSLESLLPIMDYCNWIDVGQKILRLVPLQHEFEQLFSLIGPGDSKAATTVLSKMLDRTFAMQLSLKGKTKMPFEKTPLAGLIIQKLAKFYTKGPKKTSKDACAVYLRQSEAHMRGM